MRDIGIDSNNQLSFSDLVVMSCMVVVMSCIPDLSCSFSMQAITDRFERTRGASFLNLRLSGPHPSAFDLVLFRR